MAKNNNHKNFEHANNYRYIARIEIPINLDIQFHNFWQQIYFSDPKFQKMHKWANLVNLKELDLYFLLIYT